MTIDLGIDSLAPTPELAARPSAWEAIARRLADRPFLRAEGLATVLGPPQVLSGALLDDCRDLVARFDAFYREAIAAYYREPSLASEFLVNPLWERALDADRAARMPLPLSRLDCILTDEGRLRVIEINPVGVCTIHLRAAGYLARVMARAGLADDARLVGSLYDDLFAAFARFADGERPSDAGRPRTVGIVTPANMNRGSRVLWREMFARHGWSSVDGTARDVEVRSDGLALRGRPIDVLWADYLFYLGYQYVRYRETQWGSKLGDYRRSEDETVALAGAERVLDHLRARRVINISPASAYLALSKNLLSWIHRADRPLTAATRPWLADHVARTYGLADRADGTISVADAIRRREGLLVKPCQYGGAHGVLLGIETAGEEWARRLEAVWGDPGWALQEYHPPRRTPTGLWPIFGLYNYGGVLGGVTIQCAPSAIVSVRRSTFIPVVSRRVGGSPAAV